MEKHIIELLKTNETVIIPKFGALMITVSGKGVIMFNEHLKFNDGLLVNHIADKEKISKDDATKKVEEFALGIMESLNSGKKHSIKGLGEFIKDKDGEIQFLQEGNASQSISKEEPKKSEPKSEETKPTSSKESKKTAAESTDSKKKQEPLKDDKKKDSKESKSEKKEAEVSKSAKKARDDKSEVDKTKEITADKKESKPETKAETDKKKEEPIPTIPISSDPKSPEQKEEEPKATSSADKSNAEIKKNDPKNISKPMDHVAPQKEKVELPKVEAKTKKKKKGKRVVWLVILLLLIGAGTFTALEFEMVKGWYEDVAANLKGSESDKNTDSKKPVKKSNDEPIVVDSSEIMMDTSLVDTINTEIAQPIETTQNTNDNKSTAKTNETKTSTPVVKQQPKKTNTVTSQPAKGSTGGYHIIANAFSNESYADRYVNELQGKGLSGASKLGRINGLYQVAAGSYSSMSDAKAALNDVRSKTGTSAWIMKY